MNRPTNILGDISAAEFLKKHWQREPLLVRGALADCAPPLTAEELAGLSLEAEIESRIVTGQGSAAAWELHNGPFSEQFFQQLPDSGWTLLVQAIDLWVPESAALLDCFDFLPRWRLDDIMASYAARGGSVGPHYDQYDVFLIQMEGQRLWKIGARCDAETPLLAETDLRIVEDFETTQEWLLNPGDMLYLPPRLSHWGIAKTDCMTFSVGFRSPTLADMLYDLAIEITAQGSDRQYADPVLTPEMASEAIHPAFIQQARKQLLELLSDDELIGDWFARFMTAPKYPDLVEQTEEQRRASINGRNYHNGDTLD
jgi:50S ribosomal protein L16 3-hydroxylase